MKIIILQINPNDSHYLTIRSGIIADPDKLAVMRANFSHYCVVYQDELEIPPDRPFKEYVYETFNLNHPDRYEGQSMSTGDILLWTEDNVHYHGALCLFVGWDDISDEDVQTMIDQITGSNRLEDF